MPDTKWSQFPSASDAYADDEVVGLKNGQNSRFSFAKILALIRQNLSGFFVPTSAKGVANGVASLDNTGKVPSTQLSPISSDAADISYDNTASGLTATDVQEAIDELAQGGGGGTTVVANPVGAATDTLTKLQVANTIYSVSGGGSGANEAQLAYVESGTTASRNYTAGQYIALNGLLYTADTAIASGATFYTSGGNKNLTECVGGGFNSRLPVFHSVTPNSSKGVTVQDGGYWTIGKIVIVNVRLSCPQAMNPNDILASGLPTYGGSTNWVATANNLHQDIPIGRASGTLFLAGGVSLSAGSVVIAHSVYISN